MQYAALVDGEASRLALVIGARIRRERLERRWTLDQLAEVAGVSRRMLVTVEQGAANPSIGTLLRLSDALGIGLPALVEQPQALALRPVRAGSGAVLWRSDAGGRAVLVAGTAPPDVVELWDWTLPAGDAHRSEAHTQGTRELAYVLDGQVTITVGGQDVVLGTGDALTFPGDVPHGYANHAEGPARFTLAVFEPKVGTVRREDAPHA